MESAEVTRSWACAEVAHMTMRMGSSFFMVFSVLETRDCAALVAG